MFHRVSSRDAAQSQAQQKRRVSRSAYQPMGIRYSSFAELYSTMGRPAATWTYVTPNSPHGTMVLLYNLGIGRKEYSVLSEHKGKWYCDFPEPPYLLYQRYQWTDAETVYVCEGEKTADAAESMGLAATTSLGGPTKAALSDWSPLEGKQVVVLRDFDEPGRLYAEEVAQRCLGAGARSAKIVTLPKLKEGEGLIEWIGERLRWFGQAAMQGELEKLVAAATPVNYVQPPYKPPKGPRADLQCLSDVVPEPLEWVFEGVIPRGKLTLVTGEPGVGKSLIMHEVAAGVTRVDRSPRVKNQYESGAVILFSPEDGLADTIRPRLEAAGADLSRVFALRGVRELDDETGDDLAWSFQLDRDLPILQAELQRLNKEGTVVRLIVIDPIECYRGFADDPSKADADSTARRLAELAAASGVAIVLVSDFSRSVAGTGSLTRSIRRTAGSGAFAAAARSVWMVAQDLKDPKRRVLLPVKTNLCEPQPGLAYAIQDGIVRWDDQPVPMTGDEFMTQSTDRKPAELKVGSELFRAVSWLEEQLNGGRVSPVTIRKDAYENIISESTLRRAYGRLKCKAVRDKIPGPWYWCLPGHELATTVEKDILMSALESVPPRHSLELDECLARRS